MARKQLFKKKKETKPTTAPTPPTPTPPQQPAPTNQLLAEHRETLYSAGTEPPELKKTQPWQENLIRKKIDTLDLSSQRREVHHQLEHIDKDGVNKKVDTLLLRKTDPKPRTHIPLPIKKTTPEGYEEKTHPKTGLTYYVKK